MDDAPPFVETCSKCAFWEHAGEKSGICRRLAPMPTLGTDDIAHWPLTYPFEGCGEGKAAGTSPNSTLVRCGACIFWRPVGVTFRPMQMNEQFANWWKQAGHCARFAPKPSPVPGIRTFWCATNSADYCGEGRPKVI